MNEWAWGFLTATALAVFIWLTYRRSVTEPSLEPGTIVIHPEVGSAEFSRLFAGALLDGRGRDVIVGLMKASGMNFTPREAVMIRFVLGEITKDDLLREIDGFKTENPSFHDPRILLQQMQVLTSVLSKEGTERLSVESSNG
jgi:hypothetical protein